MRVVYAGVPTVGQRKLPAAGARPDGRRAERIADADISMPKKRTDISAIVRALAARYRDRPARQTPSSAYREMSPATASSHKAFSPPHPREPWNPPACDMAWIHAQLAVMKGTKEGTVDKTKLGSLYLAAKSGNDFDAALELVDALWRPESEGRIVDTVLKAEVRPIIAFPHPGFDDEDAVDQDAGARLTSRNAIPFAIAERVRVATAGIMNQTVLQSARVGRTKLARFPRFVFQPSFVGEVDPTRPYVLVDDTFTLGGTLAVMRSYIVKRGGTVIGVTALAHSLGRDVPFALTSETSDSLIATYGAEMIPLWEGRIGHEPARLTEAEGRFLLEWGTGVLGRGKPLLHELGARLDRARATCG